MQYHLRNSITSSLSHCTNLLRKMIKATNMQDISPQTCQRYQRALDIIYQWIVQDSYKPDFHITETEHNGKTYSVTQSIVARKPFCNLVRFTKEGFEQQQPKVLIIAPISGHFATLLRDTVRRMIPNHTVYITDWISARNVHISAGTLSIDTYMDYIVDFLHTIGYGTHLMAVCQPAPLALAITAFMNENDDPCAPFSIIPMGGPIDPPANKTSVNNLADNMPLEAFQANCATVPSIYIGAGRQVCPGFVQLAMFIAMNPDKHLKAQLKFLDNSVKNDEAAMQKHIEFYDEYLSTLDMDATFYLETIERLFKKYELSTGKFSYRGKDVHIANITNTALLTIEGENDDISAPGQTYSAHKMCSGIAEKWKEHYLQPGVGHYGVFSGSKWRAHIAPVIERFIARIDSEMRQHRPYDAQQMHKIMIDVA